MSVLSITESKNIHAEQEPIKVVMSAAFVSDDGVGIYNEMFDYLARKLNRKIEFVSGFSYDTINKMLEGGMVDVGFICGLPYVMKKDKPEPSVELLLAPVMKDKKYMGKPIYYSYLIVNKSSPYKEFNELKGKTFVYNDEISNSGYNMPRAYLIQKGETSGFFNKVLRSGSHAESIRMIAEGEADVSAVDSLVYDYDKENNPQYVNKTRIIKVLGPAGIPPVVVSVFIPVDIKNRIKKIMLAMNNDTVGKQILDKALVDRFVIVDDKNYDGIRMMMKMSVESGYKVIH